ncbi:hypothetical protein SARC_05882 [Sphaeroforma arctica JP610]|uniref:E2F/DP family winged-helix DNA-binding domain-containing protein n=1 Tax=Sphaeroforma arctica JP610 TaxID=667725 RepID=A0A0L0G0T4_9EUKA|nr:hypothetical protein SARC_05882 [Sphaeroforma arctica JP610]KNC81818.1 hypothetical protein SARC_05882 [Sphaeroforma arctica JP610]|eukprot:XP_014155720.1 hypothetical protein SARC_05882 [Sphaeroforma arctica JP610]
MGSASDLTKDVLVTPATRSTTAAAGTIVKDTVTNTNSARALFTDNNKTKQALEQELPYETPESRFLPRTRPKRSSASSGVASLAAGANGSQILSAGAGLRTGAGMSQSATDTTSSPSSSKIPARTNPNSFGTGRPVSPIGGESGNRRASNRATPASNVRSTRARCSSSYGTGTSGGYASLTAKARYEASIAPAPNTWGARTERAFALPVWGSAPEYRALICLSIPRHPGPYYAAAPPLGTAPRTIVPTPTHSTVTTETANNNNNNNNGIISAMSAINPTTVSDTAHPDDENGGEKITGVVPSHVTSTSVAPDTEATQTEAESAVQAQSDSQIQENTQKQTQTNTHTHTQTAGNGQALTASPLSQQQHHQQQQQQQQQQLQGVPGYIPAPPPHTQSQQQQQHAHLQQQYPPNHPYARPGLQQPLQGYPPRGQMMVRGPPFMGQHLQPHPHQTGHPDHMIALHPQHQDQRPHMRPMPGTAGMPRPGMVAGGPGMGTPVKPEGRLNKGLRHFSAKVCEKLKIKGTTTYQVVSDELVNEMKAEYEADGNNCRRKPFDHKNIRRRVYDALNILQALHIIDRQRKLLVWQGFPQDSKVTVKKLIEDKAMRAHQLAEKKAALDEKILQKVMLSQVFEHNKQREAEEKSSDGFEPKLPKATLKSLGGDEEGKDQKLPPQLGIPFVLMQSPIGHNVEVTSNEDLTFYRFKYRGLRFGLEDEVSTLQKMGYGEGLVTNTCTPEALQRLKQYVPESVQPYLEERCSAKMFLKAPEDLPQPPPPNAPVLGGPGPSAPASVQSSPIPKQENGVSSTQAFS